MSEFNPPVENAGPPFKPPDKFSIVKKIKDLFSKTPSFTLEEFTKRQYFGAEYTQNTTNLPKKIHWKKQDENWKINLSGKAKNPPEIDRLPELHNFYTIFHDPTIFILENRKTHKKLDLLKITPEKWKQKTVSSTSPHSTAPEIHRIMNNYTGFDAERNEIISGFFPLANNTERFVKITLWNILKARFIEEIGYPATEDSIDKMVETITERREQILNTLNGDLKNEPQSIALLPFN